MGAVTVINIIIQNYPLKMSATLLYFVIPHVVPHKCNSLPGWIEPCSNGRVGSLDQ
jgi:hypothetical protein